MGLNKSTGNMYSFITHTWNTIKGKCYHDCSYCYMKRWGFQKPTRFDESELKTDLGNGNFIFIGSSNDMFAIDILGKWVIETLKHCNKFDNKYLFQSKNPEYFDMAAIHLERDFVLCTTIETNRYNRQVMGVAPSPKDRAMAISKIYHIKKYVTIEPIMDFDLVDMVELIKMSEPEQVNIGADSGNNHLPEPSKEKILELIEELKKFTIIHNKSNLKRLLV